MSVTVNGSNGLTFNDGSTQATAPKVGMVNRIINGAMMIDQRNAGASVTPTNGQYVTDRWKYLVTQSSKLTSQQSTVAPSNYTNSLLATSSSAYSIVAGDAFVLQQFVEGFNVADLGWGTANAQPVTLSFWVRSSLTGTFGGALGNSAIDRSYPFSYTISSANTWEQKSVTITGDTSGTWVTNSGIGIRLSFGLGVGSDLTATAGSWTGSYRLSATGATSVVGTNGATFYITGVQLEKGSTATSFDYRPYGTELALCQRYYIKLGSQAYNSFGVGYGESSTEVTTHISLPVTMRSNPTMSMSGSIRKLPGATSVTSIGYSEMGTQGGYTGFVTTSNTVNAVYLISANNSSSAFVAASAEL